ncbi:hypothetical protein Q3G72_007710 [Acer saccharum]|nr:hypothetical protein Q3G72_007710 [Acer saccharum]
MWTPGSNPWLDELKSKLLIAYNNCLVSTRPEVKLEEQEEWAGDRDSYDGSSGADVFTRKLAVTTRWQVVRQRQASGDGGPVAVGGGGTATEAIDGGGPMVERGIGSWWGGGQRQSVVVRRRRRQR